MVPIWCIISEPTCTSHCLVLTSRGVGTHASVLRIGGGVVYGGGCVEFLGTGREFFERAATMGHAGAAHISYTV